MMKKQPVKHADEAVIQAAPDPAVSAAKPLPPNQVPLFNMANVLTVIRLIFVPVFLTLLVMNTDLTRMSATFIFILAAATDQVDGYLARKYNLVTNFGKILDPIADKFLVMGAFIALSGLGELYWWFTILVVFREVAVTGMRIFLLKSNIVLAANMGGKVKTTLQIFLVVVLLVGKFMNSGTVGIAVGWISVALVLLTWVATMLTGIDYFIVGIFRYQTVKKGGAAADDEQVNSAFMPKKGKGVFGRKKAKDDSAKKPKEEATQATVKGDVKGDVKEDAKKPEATARKPLAKKISDAKPVPSGTPTKAKKAGAPAKAGAPKPATAPSATASSATPKKPASATAPTKPASDAPAKKGPAKPAPTRAKAAGAPADRAKAADATKPADKPAKAAPSKPAPTKAAPAKPTGMGPAKKAPTRKRRRSN